MAVPLHPLYAKKVRFFLTGIGDGIPLGDRARIEQALAAIPNAEFRCRVYEAVDRCEEAYRDTRNTIRGLETTVSETYAGDINRTVLRAVNNRETRDQAEQQFWKQVDWLARILWTPEFLSNKHDIYRFARP
ncbi:MAG: hypothetical protein ACO3YZ_06515, partial [Candidatus Nanopelagicaceae bacterium]